jgi:hypothetical protein
MVAEEKAITVSLSQQLILLQRAFELRLAHNAHFAPVNEVFSK